MRAIGALMMLLAASIPVSAAEGDQFERLLFPVVVRQHPAGYGTIWNSEVVVRNEGDIPLEMFLSECLFRCDLSRCSFVVCEGPIPTPAKTEFDSRWLYRGELGWVGNPGSILYVPKNHSHNVVASLRLVELTGRGNEFGVEIPVVREAELFEGVLWLPDVPIRSEARTHLRIYGVESPTGDGRVRLRVLEGKEDAVVLDRVIQLHHETPTPGDNDEYRPSYGFVDLSSVIGNEDRSVRVRLDPLVEGLRFWAFASLAGNVSQQVTVISPQ
jgi:hypothetical protein